MVQLGKRGMHQEREERERGGGGETGRDAAAHTSPCTVYHSVQGSWSQAISMRMSHTFQQAFSRAGPPQQSIVEVETCLLRFGSSRLFFNAWYLSNNSEGSSE
eukprot:scaffold109923_cov30-Tisochrysis_lutea.AAC.9